METMYVERLRKNEDGDWAWLTFAEEFDLEKDFTMDEDNVSAAICQMGQLLVRYGTLDADQQANLKRKEEGVKLVRDQVASALRSDAEKAGVKLTEARLAEQVTQHEDYQTALLGLHILRADSVRADHWWRSMLRKADLLNSIAYRQMAEIKRMG
jgi:hypothetical protein